MARLELNGLSWNPSAPWAWEQPTGSSAWESSLQAFTHSRTSASDSATISDVNGEIN